MIQVIDTKSIVEGDSYVVWYDFTFGGEDGIFILHMEGGTNRRKLISMVKYIKSLNDRIYFCEGVKDVWKNHRELVGRFDDTKQEIYRFVWGGQGAKCLN